MMGEGGGCVEGGWGGDAVLLATGHNCHCHSATDTESRKIPEVET